jgi:hypothetical protein
MSQCGGYASVMYYDWDMPGSAFCALKLAMGSGRYGGSLTQKMLQWWRRYLQNQPVLIDTRSTPLTLFSRLSGNA